ncbi:MAG TPA: VanZ family protein, partial [Tepidisphaeraceae bacterium]
MGDIPTNAVPPRDSILTQRVARGLGVFIFVTAFLCILFATTFPFDFSIFPADTALQKIRDHFDWSWTQFDPHYTDRIENVLLFMPLGFGVASLFFRRQKFRFIWQIVAAFFISCVLSTSVEISQTFISFRDPSLMDIRSNSTGGTLGAIVFILIGESLLRGAARALMLLRPLARPAIIGGVLAIYALFQLSVPLLIRNPRNLSNWDEGKSLVIGNRYTGDRSWSGKESRLVLADRALDASQIMRFADSGDANSIVGSSLLADYSLKGSAPYTDSTGQSPPLLWRNGPAPNISDQRVNIDPEHWLRTPAPIAPAIARIAKSWEFTLIVDCASDDLSQSGPARIMTLTDKHNDANLELGQEGPQLSVRL